MISHQVTAKKTENNEMGEETGDATNVVAVFFFFSWPSKSKMLLYFIGQGMSWGEEPKITSHILLAFSVIL